MFRLFAICTAAVLAAGCVSIGSYPDEWAELAHVKSGACPVIDGEYLNQGESSDMGGDEFKQSTPGLAQILSQGFSIESYQPDVPAEIEEVSIEGDRANESIEGPAVDPYEKVSLELVDKTLKVTVTGTDGSTSSFERPVLSRCRGSMMLVAKDWSSTLDDEDMPTSVFLHLLEREAWKLGRAEDGSLLLHVSYGGSLMVLQWPILPVLASGWMRFPAIPPAPAQLSSLTP